jgi:hypothetical protein
MDSRQQFMKIALLALLGAILGALGGGAIGVVAGIGWIELVKTANSEAMLVFFTFMPIGAVLGAAGGAILFGVMAARDAEIPVAREPIFLNFTICYRVMDIRLQRICNPDGKGNPVFVQCKNIGCGASLIVYFEFK